MRILGKCVRYPDYVESTDKSLQLQYPRFRHFEGLLNAALGD